MKRKRIIRTVIIVLAALLLLFPKRTLYKDGGTATYTALLYQVIVWHQLQGVDMPYRTGVEVRLFPHNFGGL
ncbi:hypothetical protein [Bittarella sp. HCP28S3_D9]|uniref:hypothetical protein n=1 Tax=Bittarella sp. HCP28S3_D9 TaxID=3440253 RepID=UPI003F8BDFCA